MYSMQRLNVSSCKNELNLSYALPNLCAQSYAKMSNDQSNSVPACDMLFKTSITTEILGRFFTTATFCSKLMK